jgi:hypothetical protein
LTKAIANRLEKTLKEIVSTDQSGFVKGRYIGCNIQRIQNTIELCTSQNINGAIVNIDFEKAFDTIEWDFIYKSLEILNYPQKFINWIKSLYKDIETCIINNGNTTKYFYPERGVRQGCPISPYLFIITTEIMNRWIKKKLDDIAIKNNKNGNYLIAQFADDTSFSIRTEKQALHRLFKHLETYGIISGLKLNIEKTEILKVGKTQDIDIPKRYQKYIKHEINYLGCKIQTDQEKTTDININAALEKLTNQLERWKHRATTLSGKIAIIKSLLIPQVTYILTTMTSPTEDKLKDLERDMYKFLNNGGTEKIKRNVLIGEYENGGYKMTDLESYVKAIKISWLQRIISIDGIWKEEILNNIGVDLRYLLKCNLKYKDIPFKEKLRRFKLWDEIFKYWCEENYEEVEDKPEKILNQPIWLNSHIKINKKVPYWKNWYDEGFKYIADLIFMDNQGKMSFMTPNEIKDFHIKNYNVMEYNSLISAIPKKWKKTLLQENELQDDEEQKLIEKILENKKPMKCIYTKLVEKKSIKPLKSIEKWKRELNITTEEEHILNGHKKNHYCTINNRLRSFNCNFINRNIPYNKRLHKMGKKPNATCTHCGEEETINHMYWDCKEKRKLWDRLKMLYEEITQEILEIDKEICLLNPSSTKGTKKPETQRLLYLLTKHYIHLMKCKEDKRPKEKELELYIRNHLKTEKESSKKRGSENRFIENWGVWIPWIEQNHNQI